MKTLSQIDKREMFLRGKAWLSVDVPSLPGYSETLSYCLTTVLGIWICDLALGLGAASYELKSALSRLQNLLFVNTSSEGFNAGAYDSKLLLLCCRLMHDNGFKSDWLQLYCLRIDESLASLESVPLRFTGEALILSKIGFSPKRLSHKLEWSQMAWRKGQLVFANLTTLRETYANIGAATQYGRCRLKGPQDLLSELRLTLPCIAAQALRDYQIEAATLALRALSYLHWDHGLLHRQGIEFLIQQQRSDGRFGYMASELAELLSASGDPEDVCVLRLYLPLTVSCLWSLAKTLVPNFSIYH